MTELETKLQKIHETLPSFGTRLMQRKLENTEIADYQVGQEIQYTSGLWEASKIITSTIQQFVLIWDEYEIHIEAIMMNGDSVDMRSLT